jgi:thiamine biosynthesis lipoprotein
VNHLPVSVTLQGDHCRGLFQAMASPCEILVNSSDLELTQELTKIAWQEAMRIQNKFSRYDENSLCSKINASNQKQANSNNHKTTPQTVAIDEETFQLLEYANSCFEISHGMFDITSGILREVWKFDGTDKLPSQTEIDPLLTRIGWDKVFYDSTQIMLPAGMEIDFGGIAKEYAVDKTVTLLTDYAQSVGQKNLSLLINFGGDLFSTGPKLDGSHWQVGIENSTPMTHQTTSLSLNTGAIATSGFANRFQFKNGIRYGHILDPNTGWPIENAPASVTVAAPQCITAGMLATLAILQGNQAQNFLNQQSVEFWIR